MNLVLVGLSHHTAPVSVRERYAALGTRVTPLDEKLVQSRAVSEAALVATCNRTELIGYGPDPDEAAVILRRFLHDEIGDGSADDDQLYELRGAEAAEHLFEVAASLDSMVVGEAQILGQVKDAYRAAVAARSCGPVLNRLFQRAFRAAKRIRTETGLGASSVSVARVGVQLAREVFESFDDKCVLLLGAGEMAESAALGLRDAGVRDTVIVNRTVEHAQRLAVRLGGRACALDRLEAELTGADVVITSIQTERPILGRAELESALRGRQGRAMLVIDLGLPRNVAVEGTSPQGAYVYDLDDLEEVAERGRESRQAALTPAREIVAQESQYFLRWHSTLPLVPTIRELRRQTVSTIEAEVRRNGLSASRQKGDGAAVTRMAEAIAAKILHRPLQRLRAEAEHGGVPYYAEAVRRLFDLDEEDD